MQYKIHYFPYFNYSLKTTDFTLILTKSAWFSSLRDTPPLATPPSLCQLQTEASCQMTPRHPANSNNAQSEYTNF